MTQALSVLSSADEAKREAAPESEDPLRALLDRHRRGDVRAFREIVTVLSRPVYAYLTRCGFDAAERDDLFQEVFCKVHRVTDPTRPKGPVRPWVLRITVNVVRDHLRRRKVRAAVQPARGEVDAASAAASPEARARGEELAAFLDAEIAKLPLPQREALLLASVQGLGVKAAAEVLEVPTDTVKTRLRRARASIAAAMRRAGHVPEIAETRAKQRKEAGR